MALTLEENPLEASFLLIPLPPSHLSPVLLSLLLFKNIFKMYFVVMCMGVSSACMSVCHVHVQGDPKWSYRWL